MIFTVRKNIYYHRIDEPAPRVTLHIISESKITFSVCVTTLAPFVTSDCPGRSSKNAQLYLFTFVSLTLMIATPTMYLPKGFTFSFILPLPKILSILPFYTF